MEKGKTKKTKKTTGVRKRVNGSGTSPNKQLIILDTLVFFILLLAVSYAMLAVSLKPDEPNKYFTEFDETDEFAETFMQAILGTTVPETNYIDSKGQKTDFTGRTVEDLILIDLAIRAEASSDFNETHLMNNLEEKIFEILNSVFHGRSHFLLWVGEDEHASSASEQNSTMNIVITSLTSTPKVPSDSEPTFEKHLNSPTDTKGDVTPGNFVMRLYFL